MKIRAKTVDGAIKETYYALFDYICDRHDNLYELKIVYKETTTGKTIIRSWRDREKRLADDN